VAFFHRGAGNHCRTILKTYILNYSIYILYILYIGYILYNHTYVKTCFRKVISKHVWESNITTCFVTDHFGVVGETLCENYLELFGTIWSYLENAASRVGRTQRALAAGGCPNIVAAMKCSEAAGSQIPAKRQSPGSADPSASDRPPRRGQPDWAARPPSRIDPTVGHPTGPVAGWPDQPAGEAAGLARRPTGRPSGPGRRQDGRTGRPAGQPDRRQGALGEVLRML
jgi:hypothetical protein